jgi:hypothetical protein
MIKMIKMYHYNLVYGTRGSIIQKYVKKVIVNVKVKNPNLIKNVPHILENYPMIFALDLYLDCS